MYRIIKIMITEGHGIPREIPRRPFIGWPVEATVFQNPVDPVHPVENIN